jgi:hypothetical protein
LQKETLSSAKNQEELSAMWKKNALQHMNDCDLGSMNSDHFIKMRNFLIFRFKI